MGQIYDFRVVGGLALRSEYVGVRVRLFHFYFRQVGGGGLVISQHASDAAHDGGYTGTSRSAGPDSGSFGVVIAPGSRGTLVPAVLCGPRWPAVQVLDAGPE